MRTSIFLFLVLGLSSWLGAADQVETDVSAIRGVTKAWHLEREARYEI